MYERVPILKSITAERKSGCCELFITICFDNDMPVECFISTSGTGCSASINALGRMISLLLQSGVPVSEVSRSLSKIKCPSCVGCEDGSSCADVVGRFLNENHY